MSARLRLKGSCPVCGKDVPRAHARWSDGIHEIYRCPSHGPIEYSPRSLSLLSPPTEASWLASVGSAAPRLVWEV